MKLLASLYVAAVAHVDAVVELAVVDLLGGGGQPGFSGCVNVLASQAPAALPPASVQQQGQACGLLGRAQALLEPLGGGGQQAERALRDRVGAPARPSARPGRPSA